MKIALRPTLERGFIEALDRLGAEPWTSSSQRWFLSRAKKAIRQAHKEYVEHRNKYIEEHGRFEAEILMARIGLLRAMPIAETSRQELITGMETRLATLCSKGEESESKMIDAPGMKAWVEQDEAWKDEEFEIHLEAKIEFPDECKLTAREFDLLDPVLTRSLLKAKT